jgi:deoxycytidine triphosphate deaminase
LYSTIYEVFQIEKVDVVVGTEITYMEGHGSSLVKVLNTYMKRDGVFYEILDEERPVTIFFIEITLN